MKTQYIIIALLLLAGCSDFDESYAKHAASQPEVGNLVCWDCYFGNVSCIGWGSGLTPSQAKKQCCNLWSKIGIGLTGEEMAELNYTGKHQLWAKTNRCGSVKIAYTVFTNKTHTSIFDKDSNFLGEYISDSCINITKIYNNVTFDCYERTKEVVYMVIE
jgi:hypothetical protein